MATTTKPLAIRGVAHPPPPRRGGRTNRADLTRAEIDSTNLSGKKLLREHNHGDEVGTVLASWPGADGSLRICANVEEPKAVASIRNGTTRGLSLGTDLIMSEQGDVLYRTQNELSVCVEGKRENTRIDTIDGRVVHAVACASKRQESAPFSPQPRTLTLTNILFAAPR